LKLAIGSATAFGFRSINAMKASTITTSFSQEKRLGIMAVIVGALKLWRKQQIIA
tara:strand:+ start:175 stop:339 length:165 start_codon:yes stop_codon:yes gene_type:complete